MPVLNEAILESPGIKRLLQEKKIRIDEIPDEPDKDA